MVLVKTLEIFHLPLLDITGQENVSQDILKRKSAFLDRKKGFLNYKNKELNKRKNWDFI